MDFQIVTRLDVYANAPQATSAAKFGTLGITFRARKPIDEAEWTMAAAALACAVP